jgi:hypothetical protein
MFLIHTCISIEIVCGRREIPGQQTHQVGNKAMHSSNTSTSFEVCARGSTLKRQPILCK